MNSDFSINLITRKETATRYFAAGILLVALVSGIASLVHSQNRSRPESPRAASLPASIPTSEFSRIVHDFSEPGGYFQADNFTSNETSYLHVVDKLRELGVSGGAYVGVGPEQNFTYIAKIHPSIAFIVDIRRQAIIEHLVYKAIFHLAKNRAEFLSLLFSRPLSKTRAESNGPVKELLKEVLEAPTSPKEYSTNLTTIRQTIEDDFQFPLTPEDAQSLARICYFFWRFNLGIAYGYGFPTLGDLILETDLQGREGNFLTREQDYQYLREFQERNRLIPVVGDFAGTKALTAVANYLRTNGYTTSAFYTSNVEEYLYQDQVFGRFVDNIRKFPISDRTVFIRAVKGYLGNHPAWVPGSRMITLLEKFSVFLADYRTGLYPDYWSLVTTHYIAGSNPSHKASSPPVSR